VHLVVHLVHVAGLGTFVLGFALMVVYIVVAPFGIFRLPFGRCPRFEILQPLRIRLSLPCLADLALIVAFLFRPAHAYVASFL
jgi:hypothetical protein